MQVSYQQNHLQSHTGELPEKNTCSAMQVSYLQNHLQSHTGELPEKTPALPYR